MGGEAADPAEKPEMSDLEQIVLTQELILRKLDALAPKRAPLTITQFAELTGFCAKTVSKKISAGEIRVVDRRIPASELDKFLS